MALAQARQESATAGILIGVLCLGSVVVWFLILARFGTNIKMAHMLQGNNTQKLKCAKCAAEDIRFIYYKLNIEPN